MEEHGSGLAMDYAEAYYKVSLKRFIDEISDLAVERELIYNLPDLFTPKMVLDLTQKQVTILASEDEDSIAERVRNTDLLAALHASMQDLKRLDVARAEAEDLKFPGYQSLLVSNFSPVSTPQTRPEGLTEDPSEEPLTEEAVEPAHAAADDPWGLLPVTKPKKKGKNAVEEAPPAPAPPPEPEPEKIEKPIEVKKDHFNFGWGTSATKTDKKKKTKTSIWDEPIKKPEPEPEPQKPAEPEPKAEVDSLWGSIGTEKDKKKKGKNAVEEPPPPPPPPPPEPEPEPEPVKGDDGWGF